MNLICMDNVHPEITNYLTMDIIKSTLKTTISKRYGEYEYTDCPICGGKLKVIGYPTNVALHTWQVDMNNGERAKYAKHTLQPRRGGDPSLEYIQAYPEQAKKEFTPQEIKGAKPVWSDLPGVKSIKY